MVAPHVHLWKMYYWFWLYSLYIRIMKGFFLIAGIALLVLACAHNRSSTEGKEIKQLSAELIDGRFYLKIPTVKGDTISAFCDTGGGYTALYSTTLERLGLESAVRSVEIKNEAVQLVYAEEVYLNHNIPYPGIGGYYRPSIDKPFFEVPSLDQESALFLEFVPHDAFLGQFFFIEHAWTFDYTSGKIYVNTPLDENVITENTQALGFKKNMFGKKKSGHPSMKLEIDGEMIDFLFDTGASILLSENGKRESGATSKSIGGSFISKTVFDRWRRRHPEWRIINKGELTGSDLIEVPHVRVGHLSAGPVWFAVRSDEVWSNGMIGSMDKVVNGAIGGSFLQYFRVTVDYNSELIRFELQH